MPLTTRTAAEQNVALFREFERVKALPMFKRIDALEGLVNSQIVFNGLVVAELDALRHREKETL